MPTGYTAAIAEGVTFPEFVLRCSRAMGYMGDMRDEPFDAPIPRKFYPSDYHLKAAEQAKDDLAKAKRMTLKEAEIAAQEVYEQDLARTEKSIEEMRDLLFKYQAMLDQVNAWVPPSDEFVAFKKFMIDQITSSINYDCDLDYYLRMQKKLTKFEAKTWKKTLVDIAQRDLVYHLEEYSKELDHVEKKTLWVNQLMDSLGIVEDIHD